MLQTFLDSVDAVGVMLSREYVRSPSREGYHRILALIRPGVQCLDLSEIPSAARNKTGEAVAAALYETLSRIKLPRSDEIPSPEQLNEFPGANAIRWVIPHTEIALERAVTGPRQGDFLFASYIVARAMEFYERVRGRPYTRPVPFANLEEVMTVQAGINKL